jgi:hypothetical protein
MSDLLQTGWLVVLMLTVIAMPILMLTGQL